MCFSPVKDTCLNAIDAGNFAGWSGPTPKQVPKYLHKAYATVKGHINQQRKIPDPRRRRDHKWTQIQRYPERTTRIMGLPWLWNQSKYIVTLLVDFQQRHIKAAHKCYYSLHMIITISQHSLWRTGVTKKWSERMRYSSETLLTGDLDRAFDAWTMNALMPCTFSLPKRT
jgi:hypothetical protein